MTDLMDERLTRAAQRWQASSRAPRPSRSTAWRRASSPGAPRRWALAAVAAAAVVLVGCDRARRPRRSGHDGSDAAGPAGRSVGTAPAGAVPWAALPATHPRLRSYPHGHHRPG